MEERSTKGDGRIIIKYDYLTHYLEELDRQEAEQQAADKNEEETARCLAAIEDAFEKARIQDTLDPKIPDETARRLFCEWAEMAERLAREHDWEVLIQCDDMVGQIRLTGDMMIRDQNNIRTLGEPLQKLGEQATEFVLSGEIRNGRPMFQMCFQYDLFCRASQMDD